MPRLVLDLDDILADFTNPFLVFLKTKGVTLKFEDISAPFAELGVTREHLDEFLASDDLLGRLPRVFGSFRAVVILSDYFNVDIATSRPRSTAGVTLAWLSQNYPNLLVHNVEFTTDKGQYAREHKVFALVEDQPKYAKQFERTYLLDYPWNVGYDNGRKFKNWHELVPALIKDSKSNSAVL